MSEQLRKSAENACLAFEHADPDYDVAMRQLRIALSRQPGAPQFTKHALTLARCKVAIIFPVARLNAAHHWLAGTPLKTIWLMTPRPSMPPGEVIARGEKPGGGKMDFCWLVWEHGYKGNAEIKWLHRDKS